MFIFVHLKYAVNYINWSLFISASLKEEELFKIISMKISVLYVFSVHGACIPDAAETSYQRALFKDRIRSSVTSDSLRTHGLKPTRLICPWPYPGRNTGGGCHPLLQGIFSTQGVNLGLLHCRRILYHLSHQGSPRESPSVQFSHSVVSDSLRPHESQHARLPCPSPTPGVYSNSCESSWWCHPAVSSSVVPFSSCPQSLPASGSFPMSQLFAWGWPKYWSFSFSISPSSEHPGPISFRMDWLALLAVQGLGWSYSHISICHHSTARSSSWWKGSSLL